MSSYKNRFSYNQAVNSGTGDTVQHSLSLYSKSPRLENDVRSFSNYRNPNRDDDSSFSSDGATTIVIGPSELDKLDWLLPGEQLKHRELSVLFVSFDQPDSSITGQLLVTNYRLRFESVLHHQRPNVMNQICIDVTLGSVSKIEKIGFRNVRKSVAASDPYGVNLYCKDLRNVRLILRRESRSRRALYNCLRKYAFPNTNRLPFFANLYCEQFNYDGWMLYNTVKEFERQRVPEALWRLTNVNESYNFAGTYPSLFYVPSEVFKCTIGADNFLNSVSEFRSKKRIPVLSWFDSRTSAALVRSSQPLVGALSRKSLSDEEYVEMIINANPNSDSMIILDARPKINARANRANGGGYEDYPRCSIQFMDIQNIHEVRKSLRRLKDACFPRIRQKYFQRTLEETKWLAHLQTILEASALAAREISVHSTSVLVHCSDGWDRTAQITSLAMLLLDPFYRTIEGFAVLVEKEWCSFGHKFAQRIGHGQEKPDDAERSPIFVQFIDCVWQLYNQFTASFEFNVRFLKTLIDELYSCRFGTFLYNSERERHDLEVNQHTISLWSFILDNKTIFLNMKYNKEQANLDDFMLQRNMVHPLFWTDYYCRYSQLLPHDEDSLLSQSANNSKLGTPINQYFTQNSPFCAENFAKVEEALTNRHQIDVNRRFSEKEGNENKEAINGVQHQPRWKLNGQRQVPQMLVNELRQRYNQRSSDSDENLHNQLDTSFPVANEQTRI